jgi:hypothetical protein
MKNKRWFPQPVYYKNLIEPTVLSPKLPHQLGFLPDYLNKPGIAKSRVSQKQIFHVKNQLN